MSIVIPFTPRAKSQRTDSAAAGAPAQILFFTGVRYERQPEASSVVDANPRRRVRPPRSARAVIARQPA